MNTALKTSTKREFNVNLKIYVLQFPCFIACFLSGGNISFLSSSFLDLKTKQESPLQGEIVKTRFKV